MTKPIILTTIYAIAIAALQVVLMSAMPNTGMGGMALYYIIWPLLAVSVFVVYWLLRSLHGSRLLTLFVVTGLATFVSVWVFPQDTPMSLQQKVEAIVSWAGGM